MAVADYLQGFALQVIGNRHRPEQHSNALLGSRYTDFAAVELIQRRLLITHTTRQAKRTGQ